MKKHLLFIAVLALILPGCYKVLLNPEKKLEGRWRLHKAERIGFLNRQSLDTDYERGLFTFNRDGSAFYDDGSAPMNGNWNMRLNRDRSYNGNGDSDDDTQISFTLNLYNFNNNRILNLDFDDCRFSTRNKFIAEYRSVTYRYRYEFRRD